MSTGVVNLSKGGVVNLSKKAPGLKYTTVRLGWDEAKATKGNQKGGFLSKLFGAGEAQSTPDTIDCDAFALMVSGGRLESGDTIYFGHKTHSSGAVRHQGDNLTGAGDGDDEIIDVYLDKVPSNYDKIIIGVNIYRAYDKKQTFGNIENAFIRLVDETSRNEICRYDMSKDPEYEDKTAVLMGMLVKTSGEWSFKAIGKGYRVEDIAEFNKKVMKDLNEF